MERQEEDLPRLLPDDVLADVLRRVAPRDLAASRCVSWAWRALIDDRRLLRADLLPRSLAGFFLCYNELKYPEFFARPSVNFNDYYMPYTCIDDHCNGLILHYGCVLNPATGGWARLPERPPPRVEMKYFIENEYLAFDPTLSLHYEVFLIPNVPRRFGHKVEPAMLQSEWPPSLFILSVFSSRTGQWKERSFFREGEAAGTVADMQLDSRYLPPRHAVYWSAALYVHRQNDFVMRISISNHTYRVIKPPRGIEMFNGQKLHLGISQKGLYYALLDDKYHIWVWILDNSRHEWILNHHGSFRLDLPCLNCDEQVYGPWILENANCDEGEISEALVEQEFEWNSDDEDILNIEDSVEKHDDVCMGILGFHPYKEIVFLHRSCHRGLAYHMKSSKLEDLGNLCPKDYGYVVGYRGYIEDAFPYTPCWMGEFPENMKLLEGPDA